MATVTFTIPDPQASRVVAAFRAAYNTPAYNALADLPFVKQVIIDHVTQIVLGFEKSGAEATADSGVTPVTLT